MNDETKLPKWAQQELAVLRMDVNRLENENAVLRGQWARSNTALMVLGKREYEELWLPDNALVRFYLKGSNEYGEAFYVDVHIERENGVRLELMGYNAIRLHPQVANVVYVEAAR